MKSTLTSKLAALAPLLFAFAAGAASAHGDVKCPAHPKSEWKPHTELQQKLTSQGWVVRRMEATPTCYEVYAKDPQGKRIEAFFDPVTFERVEEK
jgi:hypothetical protein